MNKEIHIYMNDSLPDNLELTLNSTLLALNNGYSKVNTTQTNVCSTEWLVKGYRIFVHMLDEEIIEIVLGTKNKNTKRDIKTHHNLEKLLLANEFGYALEDFRYYSN